MGKKIAIVGAGVGGLATAARLAYGGHSVEVFEKLPECGGRAHIIRDAGFAFDTGPSFVLMPDFFEELFSSCGEKLADYLELKVLNTSYTIFCGDGTTFTVYRDPERTKKELERIEEGSASAYEAFLKDTEQVYKNVRPLLYQCFTQHDLEQRLVAAPRAEGLEQADIGRARCGCRRSRRRRARISSRSGEGTPRTTAWYVFGTS